MPREIPTEAEVISWFEKYSNWGRWGPDDQMGTMNFVTPKKRLYAVGLVKEGVTVSCERPVEFGPSADVPAAFARHFMEGTGEGVNPTGASDSILMGMHGGARTHLDSLSHHFHEGKMYNGYPANLVTIREGAKKNAIDVLGQGAVSRGVLLDIAHLRNKKWLEADDFILPEDLEAAEKAEGVRVEEGDILLIRTGHARRRVESPLTYGSWPGPHAACIPWLYERRVAMIGNDAPVDVSPAGYPAIGLPIHGIGISALGLWLLDHGNYEDLSMACQHRNRWEFFFIVAPLKMPTVTGSPVNPIAIF